MNFKINKLFNKRIVFLLVLVLTYCSTIYVSNSSPELLLKKSATDLIILPEKNVDRKYFSKRKIYDLSLSKQQEKKQWWEFKSVEYFNDYFRLYPTKSSQNPHEFRYQKIENVMIVNFSNQLRVEIIMKNNDIFYADPKFISTFYVTIIKWIPGLL